MEQVLALMSAPFNCSCNRDPSFFLFFFFCLKLYLCSLLLCYVKSSYKHLLFANSVYIFSHLQRYEQKKFDISLICTFPTSHHWLRFSKSLFSFLFLPKHFKTITKWRLLVFFFFIRMPIILKKLKIKNNQVIVRKTIRQYWCAHYPIFSTILLK